MDVELKSKVKTLTENFKEIKSALRWDGVVINHLEALIYGTKEKEFNKDKIKEIRNYIKSESTWNSPFRGEFQKIFSVLLDDREDYKLVYKETKKIYFHLLAKGFKKEDKTSFAALMLAMRYNGEELREKADKLIEIKSLVEELNLSYESDYMSYANLATTNKSIETIKDEIENIYKVIEETAVDCGQYKEGFALSIALGEGNITSRIERALNIRCNLQSYSMKPPYKAYPLIGLSSLIVKDEELFCKEVLEVYTSLKEEKHYKKSLDDNLMLVISLGVVLNKYFEEIRADLMDINISEEINIVYAVEDYTALSIASL